MIHKFRAHSSSFDHRILCCARRVAGRVAARVGRPGQARVAQPGHIHLMVMRGMQRRRNQRARPRAFRVAVGGLGRPFVNPMGHLRSDNDDFA